MGTSEKILQILKSHTDEWISGEILSSRLNISRAAISKQIQNLKLKGYNIDSVSKKGHCYRGKSLLLLPEEIKSGLRTAIFGLKDIHYFHEIDSTNAKAKSLAMNGASEGTLVVAETQNMGKGRKGRLWASPQNKGIYCSLVLRPNLAPHKAPALTLLTAVAMTEALLQISDLPIAIKWPNDILINGRKLAGILSELSADADQIEYIVIGIGININTDKNQFPKKLSDIATSLYIESGIHTDRIVLLQKFLHMFEKLYLHACSQGFSNIIDRLKELVTIIGTEVEVTTIKDTFQGKVVDIDIDGSLILHNTNNETFKIVSGDVVTPL